MLETMKKSIGINNNSTDVLFDIGDIRFLDDQYLFVSEINYGLFIFRFNNDTGVLNYTGEFYLYRLNWGPNTMHFEIINQHEYQLIVSTVNNNEVLVFQLIEIGCNKSASEILKLDRMHAFLIPKYYAFGTLSSINSHFMLNELYNSYEKTVSVRVSSRERDTMNDSTLRVLDLDIPISSLVFLGFIESYSNLFIVATSNEIRIYSIRKPYLLFNSYIIDTKVFRENGTYAFTNYWVRMDNDHLGKGTLILFKNKGVNTIVKNYYLKSIFHFNLYDVNINFPSEDVFIGSNLDLIVKDTYDVIREDVKINILAPLSYRDESKILSGVAISMEISTYVKENGELRAFLILVYQKSLFYFYQDFSVFGNENSIRRDSKTSDVRAGNYTSSYLFTDKANYRNDYLFAMSYDEGKPSFHVFIVSDIISWIKVIPLRNITDDGCYVKFRSDNVNYFKEQDVFVINTFQKTWTEHKNIFYYYKIVNGSDLVWFDILDTNYQDFTFFETILVQPKLYYRVHQKSKRVEVYNLDKKHVIHHVEYLIKIEDDKSYLSGHTCSEYTVIEALFEGITEFHVFDNQDVLIPRFKMTLPGTEKFESLVQGNSTRYAWVDETKILIPMSEKVLNDASYFKKTYIFVYDLSKSIHTSLVQKYEIGKTRHFYFMKLVTFQGEKILYIIKDNIILTLRVYETFVILSDDKYIPYYLENEKASFSIMLNNTEQSDLSQDITMIGTKSGLILNSSVSEIKLHVTSEMKYLDINVDDYFTGYRKFMTIEYPRLLLGLGNEIEPNSINEWTVNNTDLVISKNTMILNKKYVIATMQNKNHVQKELIYLGNKTYLYIDCREFLYLKIDQEVANLVGRYSHGIDLKIRASAIKFLPDYHVIDASPGSLGTVIILTTVDESDDIVKLWNVDPVSQPNWYSPFTYDIGHIVDIFLWIHPDTEIEYLIIGTVSHTSNFSLIFFFEENFEKTCPYKTFDYISWILATTLQITLSD